MGHETYSEGRSFVKKILISGYYGFDNAGDEAVLQAILYALKQEAPFVKPIVLSANPEKTAKEYGVEAIQRFSFKAVWKALMASDGLISGGGSLIQDATGIKTIPYYMGVIRLAQLLRKPVFIYSQGIGPVYRKFFYPIIRTGFIHAKYVSVRDRESALELQAMKVPMDKIETVVDPVLALPPITKEKVRKVMEKENLSASPILISVRFWREDKDYLDVIAEVADHLVESGETVVFIPMHEPSDREASNYVISKMKQSAKIIAQYDARTLIGIIGESKAVIGMRLHSLIFATAMGVPSIAISYDPKIDQFMAQLQQTPVGTTNDLDYNILYDQVHYILEHLEESKKEVTSNAAVLKEKAFLPAKRIAEYLSNREV